MQGQYVSHHSSETVDYNLMTKVRFSYFIKVHLINKGKLLCSTR